jgi:hypothetical protein
MVTHRSTVKVSFPRPRPFSPFPFPFYKRAKPKKKKPKPSKYVENHGREIPFSVGQIIYNAKRPSIRRLVLGEARLFRIHRYWRSRKTITCWEIPVLNIRKNANNGKKSKLIIELARVKDFAVFSDFEVAGIEEPAKILESTTEVSHGVSEF